MHLRTVRRYLATPVVPRNRPPEQPRPSGLTSLTLQPLAEYLQGRWQAGCTSVAQLQRELEAQGYRGSYSLLMQSTRAVAWTTTTARTWAGRWLGRPRVNGS